MKTLKLLFLAALTGCFMLSSNVFAKSPIMGLGKPKVSIKLPATFKKTFSKKMYVLDSADVTVWFDNNVNTSWKIIITGQTQYDDSSSPGPTYYKEFYTNSSSEVLGTIYRGSYNIYIESLDDCSVEIDISCGINNVARYIYNNRDAGYNNFSVQPINNNLQELHFDFRPYPL